MFFLNFSQTQPDLQRFVASYKLQNGIANAEPTCLERLGDLDNEIIGFKEACIATQFHRHSLGLSTSLPSMFIRHQKTAGSTQVEGYWLYHAVYKNLLCFVVVPAQFVGKDLLPIILPGDDDRNPEGLEFVVLRPCPPPLPCPQANALTSDVAFVTKFG